MQNFYDLVSQNNVKKCEKEELFEKKAYAIRQCLILSKKLLYIEI